MKLRDILLSIYEGKYEKRDGESDEDFLSRIANSGMMTGSRGYVLQKGVTDYRSEGKDMYTGEDDTDCVRADGESDEDYLSRCANKNRNTHRHYMWQSVNGTTRIDIEDLNHRRKC